MVILFSPTKVEFSRLIFYRAINLNFSSQEEYSNCFLFLSIWLSACPPIPLLNWTGLFSKESEYFTYNSFVLLCFLGGRCVVCMLLLFLINCAHIFDNNDKDKTSLLTYQCCFFRLSKSPWSQWRSSVSVSLRRRSSQSLVKTTQIL